MTIPLCFITSMVLKGNATLVLEGNTFSNGGVSYTNFYGEGVD